MYWLSFGDSVPFHDASSDRANQIARAFVPDGFGIELFPESGFNIRLGYNVRRSEELRILEQRSFAGLSAGFGIKLNKLRLSYAYSKYSTAAASSFFGLNIDLQ